MSTGQIEMVLGPHKIPLVIAITLMPKLRLTKLRNVAKSTNVVNSWVGFKVRSRKTKTKTKNTRSNLQNQGPLPVMPLGRKD